MKIIVLVIESPCDIMCNMPSFVSLKTHRKYISFGIVTYCLDHYPFTVWRFALDFVRKNCRIQV